ncbi:MAG: S-adenosylmethionine:tRNA ribosyltransferase-isomerase, partial [Pseudomonadota bacterium]
LNLVERVDEASWRVLARPGRRLKAGDVLQFDGAFEAEILSGDESGAFEVRFSVSGDALEAALDAYGAMPLPPYIARRRAADSQDRQDYQTSFAGDEAESVAAPTAGLHFTKALLDRIDASGAIREMVRLHVGLGTFAPLKEEQIKDSRLHSEWRKLGSETAGRLNRTRKEGGRVIPVGTTALRTLESSLNEAGHFIPTSGPTDIFIKPGDAVRSTDALMTNFHLPRSSLFMLVCAVMGTDVMQAAYAHAVRETYRFYSYGDACLLLPERA